MKGEQFITGRQLFALVFLAQLGKEVLSLPHVEADVVGHDTWLIVLLTGLVAQAGIVSIWWLGNRYPNRNLFAYASHIVGRPIGSLINLIYGCYYALSGLLLVLLYSDMLKRWMFVLTPRWLIILMLLAVCGYAATSTLRKMAYVSQSLMIFSLIGFLLIVFSGIYGIEPNHLLPVWTVGWLPALQGIYVAFSAFVGYDLLMYAYPYVRETSKRKVLLAMSLANACTIAFYVAVCLVCTMMFSSNQLYLIPEPIVFILKNYRVDILQSFDTLFLMFYVCIVLSTIYVYFFLAAKAFVHVRARGFGKQRIWVWAIVGATFVGGCLLKKRGDLLKFAAIQDAVSFCLVFALPFVLLAISGLRGVRRNDA